MKLLKLTAIAAVALTSLSVPTMAQAGYRHGWHGHGHRVCHWYGHGRHRHRECHWMR